ncbi:aminotransferase class III-fold pyridoxal phosphate-dependent enzyme [Haloarchaeobius sp. DT45]|uniref:aminotransferase class III-fold pyridoxal phosphate-dependent enzyme n=1 Tax=Haloarchaeobius sp. DT45 TaxID=3446116 RepID=UPI003F6CC7FC
MDESDGRASHRFADGIRLWKRATEVIPGGSQLLSKRAEMFAPEQWPAYYDEASGVTVTTLDGTDLVDMSLMGVGSCVLGYGDPDVDTHVRDAVDAGAMSTLNAPEEVELAKLMLDMHSWADMVRFGRPGGETMAMAVRLARAYTGNDAVAFCGYHGWHDWYLASNIDTAENLEGHLLPGLVPKGVPDALEGTSFPFRYNDIDELERLLAEKSLGAIVMEPIRYEEPDDGFLERVRELATEHDVPLVFDEITSGFRINAGGVHQTLGVTPDVAVYGKAMGNGYPMSAVVGTEPVMDEAQESFISSTFWTERIGPTAALATIEKFRDEAVHEHLVDLGDRITAGWEQAAERHGLSIETQGLAPLTHFSLQHGEQSLAATTLFTQEMLNRGYLAGSSVYVSYAHTDAHVKNYLDHVDDVFESIAAKIEAGTVEDALEGPVKHTKFERLN